MDYNEIVKSVLSTSIITAGFMYLIKLLIDKFVEIKIEKYKNSLEKETESFRHNLSFEAEKYKHELNKVSIEHQIKYSKLYEE